MVSDFGHAHNARVFTLSPGYPTTHFEACLLNHISVIHVDLIWYQHRHDAGDFSGDFMEIAAFGRT